MQQRYYDPAIGGFLSRDPVAVNPTTAANFCRYCYANDNPYRFSDPDGRQSADFVMPSGLPLDPNNLPKDPPPPKVAAPTAEQVATGLDHVADASSNVEAAAIVVTGVSGAAGQLEVAVPAAQTARAAGLVTVGARVAAAIVSPSKERTTAAFTDVATMGLGSAAKKASDDLEAIVVLSSKAVEKVNEPPHP